MLSKKKYISIEFDEAEIEGRNRELAILLEMSNFLATSMKMKDLLAGSLSKVLEHSDMEVGRIYLMDDEGQHLNLAAHQGIETEGLEKMNISNGFSGRAVRTKPFIFRLTRSQKPGHRRLWVCKTPQRKIQGHPG